MKKLLSKVKYPFLILGFGVVIYGFYLHNLWTDYLTEEELVSLVADIKDAENVNERYYFYYDKLYPKTLEYSSNRMLLQSILTGKGSKTPNQIIPSYRYSHKSNKSRNRLKSYLFSLAWKLERVGVTQKECLNWLLQNQGYLFGIKGVRNASQYYFEKELDSLNDKQIATLVLMTKNPRMYNPKREISKEKLEEGLKRLLN